MFYLFSNSYCSCQSLGHAHNELPCGGGGGRRLGNGSRGPRALGGHGSHRVPVLVRQTHPPVRQPALSVPGGETIRYVSDPIGFSPDRDPDPNYLLKKKNEFVSSFFANPKHCMN